MFLLSNYMLTRSTDPNPNPNALKADLYSFGVLLYELWEPFDTIMERCKRIERLRSSQGQTSKEFEDKQPLVAKLLSWTLKDFPLES